MSERLKRLAADLGGSVFLFSVCVLVPLVLLGQVAAAATGRLSFLA